MKNSKTSLINKEYTKICEEILSQMDSSKFWIDDDSGSVFQSDCIFNKNHGFYIRLELRVRFFIPIDDYHFYIGIEDSKEFEIPKKYKNKFKKKYFKLKKNLETRDNASEKIKEIKFIRELTELMLNYHYLEIYEDIDIPKVKNWLSDNCEDHVKMFVGLGRVQFWFKNEEDRLKAILWL